VSEIYGAIEGIREEIGVVFDTLQSVLNELRRLEEAAMTLQDELT